MQRYDEGKVQGEGLTQHPAGRGSGRDHDGRVEEIPSEAGDILSER